MKKHSFILLAITLFATSTSAQVTTIPAFIKKGYTGEVTIIFNPNEGNGGMKSATQCWAHTGVTINGTTWRNVSGSWRSYPDKCKMTKNTDGNWQLLITPDINTFYGCAATDEVTQLSFVFNDGPNGSLEGKTSSGGDIFVDLVDAGLRAKIESPSANMLAEQNEIVHIAGVASEEAALTISINGETVNTSEGTNIEYDFLCSTEGDYKIMLTASTAEETATDSLTVTVMRATIVQPRPEGIINGIYYDKDDATKVTLCTYAASKTAHAKAVFVVGDFNNWQISPDWQMRRDSNYFWLDVENLQPQKEYAFQYLVVRADGVQKRISDLYSTKLLHSDDKYEPKTLDPTLKSYPSAGDGYVSVLQTDKPNFQWSSATLNFQRPDKNNLVIYELWVYDYTEERSFRGLLKRLDYLERLGVNAIELMPVCEFDGNYNWGYSPNHYFAVDKAYGTENDFCTLIDECHKRGMAVIMDMVFNHATGLNPMNKLYPYGSDLAQNPWFNVTAPHSDNVYEDWNHDFLPAREMFTRALQYWLQEFHVDGYRMDLSHGFCGANCNNLMQNISHYYQNGVLAAGDADIHGEPFFILEHWGSGMGSQRPKLISEGMLCWQNTSNAYSQTAMGWLRDGDSFADANRDGYVSYCESHDEERNQYKAKTWGVDIIKNSEDMRLKRVPLNAAFNVLLNGPHMLWQYQEFGYDYSINSTKGSNTISENNRTSIKERPEPKGWFTDIVRMTQYQRVAQIIQLRTRLLPELFEGNPKEAVISTGKALRTILWDNGMDRVYVVGNFSADVPQIFSLPSGTWYDYFSERQQKQNDNIVLLPGELYIFTSRKLALPDVPAHYNINTSVDDISVWKSGVSARKVMIDGNIRILLPDGSQYDLTGRRLK